MAKIDISQSIEKPTLLLDKARVQTNIERMVRKANQKGISLRPHFKTHQSAVIGEWFREKGVSAITVSSVDMAAYFARHDWQDITIAFPVNIRQAQTIDNLARQVKLNLLLESAGVGAMLDDYLGAKVGAWLKIDTGYQRTGIEWNNQAAIGEVVTSIRDSRWLELEGILTHAGHTYATTSPSEVVAIYEQTVTRMQAVQQHLRGEGIRVAISVGDTPGCSITKDLGEVDEIRPGNFVFFDLSQLEIGSCQEEDIAVALACPVVAKHPERSQFVIYGGAVHLSKEGLIDKKGSAYFGVVSLLSKDGWGSYSRGSRLVSISQEHGLITADSELLESVTVGDIVAIIPVHSCLTANLMGHYLTLDGDKIDMAVY